MDKYGITMDDAIKIVSLGTLIVKIVIINAYCLLPVHSADRHTLQMKWNKLQRIKNLITA